MNDLQNIYLNVIHAIINVKGVFDIEYGGDIQYGLKNYRAKYSLANDFYCISENAYKFLSDKNIIEPYTRSAIYKIKDLKNKKMFIFEHPIPASYVSSMIINSDRSLKSIAEILSKTDYVAILTQDEDCEINKTLKSSMPRNWEIGEDNFIRYRNTSIKLLSNKVKMFGAVKR